MIYKKQRIVFIISFIIISFFWVAVPYANAGTFACSTRFCDTQLTCEFPIEVDEFCCVGGSGNPCEPCLWIGDDPSNPTNCTQGNDNTCCVEPATGACCLSGECSIQDESTCAAEGGIYQGDGTDCLQDTCLIGCCGDPSTPRPPGNCEPESTPRDCRIAGKTFLEDGVCDANNNCNLEVNPDHLMCFNVKDPLKIPTGKGTTETTFFVSIPQFGTDVRCKLKGRTRELCVPVCKAREGDDPVGAGLCVPERPARAFDRVCYKIENCTTISGQLDGLEVGVTDQWDDINIDGEGPRLFTNINPHQLCTPALKCHERCPADGSEFGQICNNRSNGTCTADCQCRVVCGDGVIGDGEECESDNDCLGPDAPIFECNSSCECVAINGLP